MNRPVKWMAGGLIILSVALMSQTSISNGVSTKPGRITPVAMGQVKFAEGDQTMPGGVDQTTPAAADQTKPAVASQTNPAAQKQPIKPGLAASLARGKDVYFQTCLACHQADALGVENMNPPLVKTKFVLGDKTTLVQIVLKGMTGELEIDGNTYHNVMAPHNDLSDQQIADVLTYIRKNFGNTASAISAAEVKAIRAKTKL